jgi:crotonobetainyl-CoA:carnitine CoA-transferase CaiB-like acyl-CoA transferase
VLEQAPNLSDPGRDFNAVVGIFDGVRVVELAQWVMVPAAGAVLSNLGADVIEIERLAGGDPLRNLVTAALGTSESPYNPRVEQNNSGKRSVAVDVPIQMRPAMGDHTGAMNLAFGFASALHKRDRTGETRVVDVCLLGTAMWVLSSDILSAFNVATLDAPWEPMRSVVDLGLDGTSSPSSRKPR